MGTVTLDTQYRWSISERVEIKTPEGETKTFPLREGDDGKGRYIFVHFDTEDCTTSDEPPPDA